MIALVLYGLAKPCNAAAEGGVRERGQTGKRAEEGGLSTSNPPQRQHVRRHGETIMPNSDPPIYSPAGTAGVAVEVPDYRILASGDIPGSPERGNGSISLPTLDVSFLHQHALTKGPGPLALAGNQKNLYAMTAEALLAFSVDPGSGTMEQIQELQNGVVDRNGKTVEYFTGLTALALSPDEENVYAVGTSMMPGVGGITVLKRDARGELALVQQLRVDQRKGIVDVEGMIGANSVAPSPDGRFIYVSSGGYYRDHHLLVFDREPDSGRLSLLQSIDIYNTSAARVLPSTLAVAPDGKHVYVIGDNFAISTSAIMVYAVAADGALELKQEAGPFRSALLTSASFAPSGEFLYCTATFGINLVWVFRRESDGQLTTVIDPALNPGGMDVPPTQGSYSSAVAVQHSVLGPLLLVSVEKENLVHVALRVEELEGRLAYLGAVGGAGGEGGLKRPDSMAWDAENSVLFVSESGNNAIAAFRLS
ncbi:hypothetical protein NSK_008007 [Nannochloropsis salina CCMP1776]|uniref:6-phosphogluconolactonase n=1 Tax=Nannochloropsis salina CCMP1776 TaxID=1027361 RepID=A0A4D9CN56_9STRA|nr:hypothetical protein NSK_008007 [Nannochloropsis salina CCMP1776]|eukprot:TFJ80581.1 hypothetical protein NSK_008007 [Nannochloropsis salina CCMP1776]